MLSRLTVVTSATADTLTGARLSGQHKQHPQSFSIRICTKYEDIVSFCDYINIPEYISGTFDISNVVAGKPASFVVKRALPPASLLHLRHSDDVTLAEGKLKRTANYM